MPDLAVCGRLAGALQLLVSLNGREHKCPGGTELPNTMRISALPYSGSSRRPPLLCQADGFVLTALASCLFEQNSPQHSVMESIALREGLWTEAKPHPRVHQPWITDFYPGAEH